MTSAHTPGSSLPGAASNDDQERVMTHMQHLALQQPNGVVASYSDLCRALGLRRERIAIALRQLIDTGQLVPLARSNRRQRGAYEVRSSQFAVRGSQFAVRGSDCVLNSNTNTNSIPAAAATQRTANHDDAAAQIGRLLAEHNITGHHIDAACQRLAEREAGRIGEALANCRRIVDNIAARHKAGRVASFGALVSSVIQEYADTGVVTLFDLPAPITPVGPAWQRASRQPEQVSYTDAERAAKLAAISEADVDARIAAMASRKKRLPQVTAQTETTP